AIDHAGLVANQDFRESLIELARQIISGLDHHLAALVDIAKSAFEAHRGQSLAERTHELEPARNDFFLCYAVPVATETERPAAIGDQPRLRRVGSCGDPGAKQGTECTRQKSHGCVHASPPTPTFSDGHDIGFYLMI